jgi:signal transduction histidine kinase
MDLSLRILHLEDDPRDAEIIRGVLEGGGIACDVTCVDTRADFVAGLARGGFDVILADFSMPSFDGLSALRIALETCPEVPFIFVSGTLGEEVAIDALKVGATDYVLKERLSRIASSVRRAVREVTERRLAQQELRRLEARLRQAQRLEAMGTLAGGIAHDFNNILGAILGYGERASRDAPPGSRLARDLESILAAGERGRALVDRVLTFSHNGSGTRVAVHVEGVVREAVDLVAARLPEGIAIETTFEAGRAAMHGDPTQVHQVLMNLTTNAIQAMPSGGTVRVSLKTATIGVPRVATIGAIDAADYIVLAVADDGIGIPPGILDRIFDPFFTTKEVGTGTGLGLSLVHGIVGEIGGAIDVSSTPGAGSAFTVYLPRAGDAAEAQDPAQPGMPRGEGQRVLVVDDEEPLVRLVERTLDELGYVTAGFTSSVAALSAFRADPGRFHAVLTDERMPGLSGSALIREVRGIRNAIPIVLMSGFVGGGLLTRALEAGADEVLKKPLSARDLAASLARVLHP